MNHDYEVVVCDKYGIAYGQISDAIPTLVEWELNGIGSATIDFPIMSPSAIALLPRSSLPAAREIQVWRDQSLIWWGVPVTASFDTATVHLQCSGHLWHFSKRFFGPNIFNGVSDGDFEMGSTDPAVTDWSIDNTTFTLYDATGGAPVLQGRYSGVLTGTNDNDDHGGISQGRPLPTFAQDTVVDTGVWAYIDGGFGGFVPRTDQVALHVRVFDADGNLITESNAPIQQSDAMSQWTLKQCAVTVPAGLNGGELEIILNGLLEGVVVYDLVTMQASESIGVSAPPTDLGTIIGMILSYANSPGWGKSDVAIEAEGDAPTLLARNYLLSDNGNILDALNEFPTAGYCDFEVVYGGSDNNSDTTDEQGHIRAFHVWSPAKGSIKWNYPIEVQGDTITGLSGSVDGSQVGTVQRVLGQGSSAGAASVLGYAAFPSYTSAGELPGGSGLMDSRVSGPDASYVVGNAQVVCGSIGFTDTDVGQPIYSLAGNIPAGAIITSIGAGSAQWDTPNDVVTGPIGAFRTLSNDVIGIGGLVVEESGSNVPNQTVGELQPLAEANLLRRMRSQVMPTPRLPADGPSGLIGNVFVGDAVPVNIQYGWLSGDTELMRIAHMSLYPVTEEVEVGLNVLNAPSPAS